MKAIIVQALRPENDSDERNYLLLEKVIGVGSRFAARILSHEVELAP